MARPQAIIVAVITCKDDPNNQVSDSCWWWC